MPAWETDLQGVEEAVDVNWSIEKHDQVAQERRQVTSARGDKSAQKGNVGLHLNTIQRFLF